MAQEMKDKVLQGLRRLSEAQLESLCGTQGLTVGTGKKSRKTSLFNAIVRTMSSEEVEDSEDEGLELFTVINEQIEKLLRESVKDKDEVKGEDDMQLSGNTSSAFSKDERRAFTEGRDNISADGKTPAKLGGRRRRSKSESDASAVSLQKVKLKDFKINGTVGVRDTVGALDWSSLFYQIREGINLGYPNREIMSGVIKAMKPGSSLRKYYESKPDMSWSSFLSTLKALYDVKDSAELLEQMSTSIQEPTESPLTFILRMMAFRDSIYEANADEESPLSELLIEKKFSHSVIVGLRSPTIRLEIKPLILNANLSEDQLLKEINKVISQNAESEKKFGKGGVKKEAAVKFAEAETKKEQDKQDQILSKLNILTAVVTTNQEHLSDLEKRLQVLRNEEQEENNNKKIRKPYKFPKCAPCERDNKYCNHCAKCGSSEHKRNSPNCPLNQ